jgi:hypothetical protein
LGKAPPATGGPGRTFETQRFSGVKPSKTLGFCMFLDAFSGLFCSKTQGFRVIQPTNQRENPSVFLMFAPRILLSATARSNGKKSEGTA